MESKPCTRSTRSQKPQHTSSSSSNGSKKKSLSSTVSLLRRTRLTRPEKRSPISTASSSSFTPPLTSCSSQPPVSLTSAANHGSRASAIFMFLMGLIWGIRYKTDVECHLQKMLEREKEDSKLLAKCVEQLKKKGLEFDLMKEVDALRRAKSLRVESKAVKKWSGRDFVTLFFFTVSCFVLGLTRVILCG